MITLISPNPHSDLPCASSPHQGHSGSQADGAAWVAGIKRWVRREVGASESMECII